MWTNDVKEQPPVYHLTLLLASQAGDKRKEEEIIETGGALGRGGAANEETPALEQTLQSKFEGGSLDAFGLYVYGRVLRDRERKEEARDMLQASVNEYPWNWSAWMELQVCASDHLHVYQLTATLHPFEYSCGPCLRPGALYIYIYFRSSLPDNVNAGVYSIHATHWETCF